MKISLSDRIKGLFARDGASYWFNHFSDEEKKLKFMTVWQLAEIIQQANGESRMECKRIVAEHALNIRLAKIQATASWGAGILGFSGAIIGAALSYFLVCNIQDEKITKNILGTHNNETTNKAIPKPIEKARNQITKPIKGMPSHKIVEVTIEKNPLINTQKNKTQKQ